MRRVRRVLGLLALLLALSPLAACGPAVVTGSVTPDALGRTLMHEHLTFGVPGWGHDPEPRGSVLRNETWRAIRYASRTNAKHGAL